MNRQVVEEWIRRLRSGEYQQTQGRLKDESGGYCCLGVLCQQYHELTGSGRGFQELAAVRFDGSKLIGFDPEDPNSHAYAKYDPPETVMRYAGLPGPLIQTLETMNDEQNMTFGEIADYLEQLLAKEEA